MEPGVVHYETAHYLDGERRDLEIDVRAALDWMERENHDRGRSPAAIRRG